jgi:hypothetical protein
MDVRRFVIRSGSVNERGTALVAAMLIMMLMSALMVGFTTVIMGDQRYRGMDKDRTRAFYGAHSGIEKLTSDLGDLFMKNVAPTATQISGLSSSPPAIVAITFSAPPGVTAYGATLKGSGSGQILSGPFQGLIALKKFYDLDVVARTLTGGEAHLTRRIETVAIPVFQFGMFSDVDLSFSAASDMDFGGRVHTNGNLFLAQGGGIGTTLTLRDRVTAVKEIVRQQLSNTNSIDNSGSIRTVRVATSTNAFRDLDRTEGSVTGGVNPATPNTAWTNISLSTYNGYLRNGRTGAKPLNLPLITMGKTNVEIVRRPGAVNENTANKELYDQRFYGKVSLRILLSDTAADFTNLPTIDATKPPVLLDGNWNVALPNNGTAYGPINAAHPPIARSPGLVIVNLSAASGGGNNVTLTTGAVPAFFRPPVLRIGVNDVTCTGRTANTFTGCAGAPAAANGTPVTPKNPVNSVPNLSTNLAANIAAGAATITVTNDTTQAFAPITFWLKNNLVTCTGNTTTTFTGCNNVPSVVIGDTITTSALSATDTGVIGGYIKIEMQDTGAVWRDVTMEILNWGISGPNLKGAPCGDPTPDAIVRVQRLRDNGNAATCTYIGSVNAADHWPNALFDQREALQRDLNPGTTNPIIGGVMYYVTLDVANLSKWFKGTFPYVASSGLNVLTDNGGYSVYFSDRRNNRNALNQETGEYGWEDFVNPASPTGVPNAAPDEGENVNGDANFDIYGQLPSYTGIANTMPPGAAGMPAPFNSNITVRPTTQIGAGQARVNRAYLFRRALKLTNGGLGNIVAPGLTIASENPVYLQGDWNANPAGFGDPHVATSVIADAVTLLSNAWNDAASFGSLAVASVPAIPAVSPYSTAGRQRGANTYYRVAVIAGKGPIFPLPAGAGATFGTDGGVHSFLRMLEGNGAGTIHYRGSMVTFYYNRQAVGAFKCCSAIVYDTPIRDYTFDVDFLDPAKLPPLTPAFRDLNALGFSQELRPGR